MLKRLGRSKVRRLYRCNRCFTPLPLALLFRWDGCGGIRLRLIDPDHQFAFLENDLLKEIMGMMAAHFGEDAVYEIARDPEKSASCAYIAMLFGTDSRWLRPLSLLARYTPLADIILESNMAFLGYGAGNVVSKKLSQTAFYTRNPFDKRLFQADVEGVFLATREREIEAKVDTISEAERIYLYHADARVPRVPGISKRYRIVSRPMVEVENPYELSLCPRCGIPKAISVFLWDARSGMIINKETQKRMILWPCYTLESLLEALTGYFGKEAEVLITNTVKRYQRDDIMSGGIGLPPEEKVRFLQSDLHGQYRVLLQHLAVMGLGHGEASVDEAHSRVRITMTNALFPVVTSGLMAGIVEALEGTPVMVSWEEGAENVVYSLEW